MLRETLVVALVVMMVGGAAGFIYASASTVPRTVVSVSTITHVSIYSSISTVVSTSLSTETKTLQANFTTNLELVNESLQLSFDLSPSSVYKSGTAVTLNVTLTNIGSTPLTVPPLYDRSGMGVALPNGTVVAGTQNPPSAGLAGNVTLGPNQWTRETIVVVFGNQSFTSGGPVDPPAITYWTFAIVVQGNGIYTFRVGFWYPQFYETLVLPVRVSIP